MKNSTNYLCYFLSNTATNKYSYVGITNNFKRRLRCHNGEITGGAKYTKRYRPWAPFVHVCGFKTKCHVLQFEYSMKRKRAGGRGGKVGRIKTLEKLLKLERWTRKAPKVSTFKLKDKVAMSKKKYIGLAGLSLKEYNKRRMEQKKFVQFKFCKAL